MRPDQLVQSIQRAKQARAALPDPEKEFAKEQFTSVISEIQASNKKLVAFLLKLSPDVTVKNFPKELKSSEIVKAVKALESSLKPAAYDDKNVIKALNQVVALQEATQKALSRLDMSPNINVPAPVVKVATPDFKSLEKAIKDSKPEPVNIDLSGLSKQLEANLKATKAVSDTIKKLRFPVSNTPTDPLVKYSPGDIDDAAGSTGINYYGFTDNFGAWYIRKFDQSVSPKTIRFCFGQSNYATNFANRAALTYTLWGS